MDHLTERRHVLFGVMFPWVVALCFVVAATVLKGLAPAAHDNLALPWQLPAESGSWSWGAYVTVMISVSAPPASLCGFLAGTRLPWRWARRLLMAVAVVVTLMGAVLGLAGLIGQMGGAGPLALDRASLSTGAGVSLAFAVVVFFVYQPPPGWGRKDEAARAEAAAAAVGAPTLRYWLHPRPTVLTLMVLTLLPGSILGLLHPLLPLLVALAVVAALLWVSVQAQVDGGQHGNPRLRLWRAGIVPVLTRPVSSCDEVTVTIAPPPTGRSYGIYRYPALNIGRGSERVAVGVPARLDAAEVANYLRFRAAHPHGRRHSDPEPQGR